MAIISKHSHVCDMEEKLNPDDQSLEINKVNDTWRLEIFVGNKNDMDEYGVANIQFCPFCGERLLTKKEIKGEM